jgi:hypothetical protein
MLEALPVFLYGENSNFPLLLSYNNTGGYVLRKQKAILRTVAAILALCLMSFPAAGALVTSTI